MVLTALENIWCYVWSYWTGSVAHSDAYPRVLLFIIFKIKIFCQKYNFETSLKIMNLCHEGEKDEKNGRGKLLQGSY